tara:strand:- start:48 stop:446 length:399 start_codon:yes stop_codon:yes gene_type:complete
MEGDKIVYPSDYSDDDKAIYDDLITKGEAMIGKKIKANDRFLLDLAAKITVNKMKGYSNNFTDDQIEQLKARHKEAASNGIIETPPDIFYDQIQNGWKHPLSVPAEEYYKQQMTSNVDIEQQMTSNVNIEIE